MPLERGEVLGGVFEVERCLETEYGVTTYRARHLLTGKPSRLRVLVPTKCPWAKPFIDQATELAAMNVEGLVRCTGFGRVGRSQTFFAFEWHRGDTVADLLPQPLPRAQSLRLAANVAEALGQLHALDLVHRHVRPDRIVIDPKSDRGPVLLDGVYPDADGLQLGSASYMAPETFIVGRETSAAADVYALGATLYHCIFGRPPHAGKTRLAVWLRALFNPLEPIALLEGGDVFGSWIGRMLAPEPLERPRAERLSAVALEALENQVPRPIERGSSAVAATTTEGCIVVARGVPWNDADYGASLDRAVQLSECEKFRFVDGSAAFRFRGALDSALAQRIGQFLNALLASSRVAAVGAEIQADTVSRVLDALAETLAITPSGQQRWSELLEELISQVRKFSRKGGTLELDGAAPRVGKNGTLVIEPEPIAAQPTVVFEVSASDLDSTDERPTIEVAPDPMLVRATTPRADSTPKN